jgi:hypothetical protein
VPLRGQLGIEKSELRERLGQLARGDHTVEAIHVRQIRLRGGVDEHAVDCVGVNGLVPGRFLRLNISVHRDRRERGPRRELEPVAAPAQARGSLHVPLQPSINYPDWPRRLQGVDRAPVAPWGRVAAVQEANDRPSRGAGRDGRVGTEDEPGGGGREQSRGGSHGQQEVSARSPHRTTVYRARGTPVIACWNMPVAPSCDSRGRSRTRRDYRPGNLYGDDDTRSRWLQLVNVAALALHCDDRDAVKAFIDLCEAPYIN